MGKRIQQSNFFRNYSFLEKDIDFKKTDFLIHNIFCFFEEIVKEIDFSSFEIGFSWLDNKEITIDFKSVVKSRVIESIVSKLDKKHNSLNHDAYFLIDLSKKSIFVYLMPVYVYGRYCKFSRCFSQTEHFCRFCKGKGCKKCDNTGFLVQNSVEQALSKIFVPKFEAKQVILHGAGREDTDVLMLGQGRPFVLEIVCPKKRFFLLEKLEEIVNDFFEEISINSLKFVDKKEVAFVKNKSREKIYRAIINCSEKIFFEKIILNKKIIIEQTTPTRVEKRRALLKRSKEIIFLDFKKINSKEFELILKTSHGTYVKEFISGDNNKTNPSLSKMFCAECFCKQLDVLEICE